MGPRRKGSQRTGIAPVAAAPQGHDSQDFSRRAGQALREEAPNLEIVLVSTYSWLPTDPVAKHIRQLNAALDRAFIEGSLTGKELASRTKWKGQAGVTIEWVV